MNTVAHTASLVHKIVENAQLRTALGSVLSTLIGGITATGSVVLSEVLRVQVDTREELHAAEQRVSHALKNATELDTLPDVYLAMVAPVARSLRFRSVDGSDVSKPAARKLEALDIVRDGSAKPRDHVVVGPAGVQPSTPRPPSISPQDRNARKRTRRNAPSKVAPPVRRGPRPRTVARAHAHKENKAHRVAPQTPEPPPLAKARSEASKAHRVAPQASPESPPPAEAHSKESTTQRVKVPSPPALKKLGYWMVQIEAGDGSGKHQSLFQDLYSTQDPAYQALGEHAWMMTYQRSIERVLPHVGRWGIWLVDRGFDSAEWMVWLHEQVDQHVLRLKANRLVHPGTTEETPLRVGQLAETLGVRHTTQIRYVDKSTHRERYRTISFAWAPIRIDGVGHPLYLIVAHTGRKRPMLLVTDRRPATPEGAGALIQAYLERWGNEEVTRAVKQLTGLERIRVRSFQAIRRLAWVAMIAVGIQELLILTRPQLRRAVLGRAKEFIEEVRFELYRVWRVVKEDVFEALKARSPLFT